MNTKLKEVFKGKVVNKALTLNTGVDEFPRYVLEYLIDNYCAEEMGFHDRLEGLQPLGQLRIVPGGFCDAGAMMHPVDGRPAHRTGRHAGRHRRKCDEQKPADAGRGLGGIDQPGLHGRREGGQPNQDHGAARHDVGDEKPEVFSG
jgi:hypothetical protein